MSILQRKVIQSLDGLSDDNLSFLLEMIQRFMKSSEKKECLECARDENIDRYAHSHLGSIK